MLVLLFATIAAPTANQHAVLPEVDDVRALAVAGVPLCGDTGVAYGGLCTTHPASKVECDSGAKCLEEWGLANGESPRAQFTQCCTTQKIGISCSLSWWRYEGKWTTTTVRDSRGDPLEGVELS